MVAGQQPLCPGYKPDHQMHEEGGWGRTLPPVEGWSDSCSDTTLLIYVSLMLGCP